MGFKQDLDADRPFLVQFEEAAFCEDNVKKWLIENIYGDTEIMALLSGCWFVPPSVNDQSEIEAATYFVSENEQVWHSVIPAVYWSSLEGRRVVTAGFGAGPGCMAQNTEHFDSPISLDQGMIWLERWRKTFKKGRLILDDGTKLMFDPHGFVDLNRP